MRTISPSKVTNSAFATGSGKAAAAAGRTSSNSRNASVVALPSATDLFLSRSPSGSVSRVKFSSAGEARDAVTVSPSAWRMV